MFDHGLVDGPVADQALGKFDPVPRLERHGARAVRDRDTALNEQTSFLVCVGPIECAWVVPPDGPGFTGGFLI